MGVAITPSQVGTRPDRREQLLPFAPAEPGPAFSELLARREFQSGSFDSDAGSQDLRSRPESPRRSTPRAPDDRDQELSSARSEDAAASANALVPHDAGRRERRDVRRLDEDRSARADRVPEGEARRPESSRNVPHSDRDASRSAQVGEDGAAAEASSSAEAGAVRNVASPGEADDDARVGAAEDEGPLPAEAETETASNAEADGVTEQVADSTELDLAHASDAADANGAKAEPTVADDTLEASAAETEPPDSLPAESESADVTDVDPGVETEARRPTAGEERRNVAQGAPNPAGSRSGAIPVADAVAGTKPAHEVVSTATVPRSAVASGAAASGVAAISAPDTALGDPSGDPGSSSRGSSGEPGAGSRAAAPLGGTSTASTAGKFSVATATVLPEGDATSLSWAERVAERVRLTRGADRIELRLELLPKGLGQIDIRLRVDAEGLHAVIVAEQEQTRALLASQQHRLEAALAQEDLNLTSFDLGLEADGDESTGEERQAGSRRDSGTTDDAETDRGGETLSTTRAPATNGRLSFWA